MLKMASPLLEPGSAGHRHGQSATCQVGTGATLASVLLGSIQPSIWSQPSQRYGMYVTIDPSKTTWQPHGSSCPA
jgi:hypothetical protein